MKFTGKGKVEISTVQEDNSIAIAVTDTGIGIPPDELTQIFDRFYRASNARFFEPDGSGLGLSIAHWIATAHGGTLTAQSMLGSGTSMLVSLPMV